MDLISDMAESVCFPEEQLATEKQVVIDEISMYNDSCEDMVHEKLRKRYGKITRWAISFPGKNGRCRAFTQGQEIMDFWRTYYTAGRMLICAAGHIDEAGFQDSWSGISGISRPDGRAMN